MPFGRLPDPDLDKINDKLEPDPEKDRFDPVLIVTFQYVYCL